ncbi:MAG: FAD-dependent oxidoreductase, partial [Myxococcota bacterium]
RTRQRLAEVAPALADIPFEEAWSGLRTFAADRRPHLGPDADRPGLWWVAGLGGSGVTCSVAAGEAVASWLRDEPTPWLPTRPVAPGRRMLRRFAIRRHGDWASTTLVDVA